MSFATSIKDFADLLTEIYTAKGLTGDFPKALLLQQTLIYSGKALISLVMYLLSFQWLRDISYLPLLTPQIDGASLFGDNLLENPASHIFSFSNIPKQATDQLFAGFLNSFFFSLPVSLPHLISLRRLFFQGPVAAAASVSGIIAAHLLFLIGVVYGFRFLIIPYFSLEPLNLIIGLIVVAILVKTLAQQKGFKLVPVWDKSALIKISFLSFVLTWCEETSVFHSLNHLTLNAQNTYFDLYPCSTPLNCFVVHTTYILAFFVGHSVFSAFFYYLLLMGSRYLASLRWFTTAMVSSRLSKLMLFFIVAFTVSSFPYYGLDYLVTKVAGFLPEDPAYSDTLLSPTKVNTKYPHFFKEIPPPPPQSGSGESFTQRDQKTPVNLDLNYFDRGVYLNAPKQQKNAGSSTPLPALSFEELNYQGEYAWIMRNQLSKDLSKMRPSVFTPMFKKPRHRYLQLRKLNDNRMEEAARVAHEKTVRGSLTQSQEGVLPGERASLFIKMTDFVGRAFLLPAQVESQISDFDVTSATNKKREDAHTVPRLTRKARSLESTFFNSDDDESDLNDSNISLKVSSPKKIMQIPTKTKNEKRDPIKEELLFEQKLKKGYSKGFAPPFSLPYERMRFRNLPIKNVIKKRYFLNNVYKSLLSTDIDAFLSRQPSAYKLAENQEFQLFEKRQILQKYYNWLRYYEPFEKMVKLRFRVPDSKSFVDRVYHQQFKGTLKIARRLFKVTFDSQQNPLKGRVLSYDQTLYKDLNEGENPFVHEELFGNANSVDDRKASPTAITQSLQAPEEINDSCVSCHPFIEESSSSPTYAGWDPVLRKFVVTNRFVLKAVN